MRKVTILGHSIRLIRPDKVIRHSARGAWRVVSGCYTPHRTHKLTLNDKVRIAAQMGFLLTPRNNTAGTEL